MSKVLAAVSARSAFALGLSAGLVLASAAFVLGGVVAVPSISSDEGAAAEAGSPARWHQPAATGTLSSAVQVSAWLLPGARASTMHTASPSARESGGGPAAMLSRAEDHRRKREFQQACDLYAVVAAQGAMTADAWADYADAQASLAGRISGDPARAIAAALALDPRHPKALWLQASLEHEEHRYGDALATWKRLLAVVPPGSSDARIVEANIAEAARLAAS